MLTDRELTEKMFAWEDHIKQAQTLENEIALEVLDRQSTFVAGNLRCTYSKGRQSYEWQASCELDARFDENLQRDFTTTTTTVTTTTDWKAMAKALGITEQKCIRKPAVPIPSAKMKAPK